MSRLASPPHAGGTRAARATGTSSMTSPFSFPEGADER
jgi:hypothetical protein